MQERVNGHGAWARRRDAGFGPAALRVAPLDSFHRGIRGHLLTVRDEPPARMVGSAA